MALLVTYSGQLSQQRVPLFLHSRGCRLRHTSGHLLSVVNCDIPKYVVLETCRIPITFIGYICVYLSPLHHSIVHVVFRAHVRSNDSDVLGNTLFNLRAYSNNCIGLLLLM